MNLQREENRAKGNENESGGNGAKKMNEGASNDLLTTSLKM